MTDWRPYLYLCVILALAACVPALSLFLNGRRERRLAANPPAEALRDYLAQGFAPTDVMTAVNSIRRGGFSMLAL